MVFDLRTDPPKAHDGCQGLPTTAAAGFGFILLYNRGRDGGRLCATREPDWANIEGHRKDTVKISSIVAHRAEAVIP
jgi:hypothetical protein